MSTQQQPIQENYKQPSNSSTKDYIVFAIGFILVMLSNFSDLSNNLETQNNGLQETTALTNTTLVKSISITSKEEF